jgi:hypothetical protein
VRCTKRMALTQYWQTILPCNPWSTKNLKGARPIAVGGPRMEGFYGGYKRRLLGVRNVLYRH